VTLTANCIATSTNLVSFAGTSGNFANIVGNCTGVNASAARNNSTGTLNITGTCTGGTAATGAYNNSTGTMFINGVIQASEFNAGVGGPSAQQVTLLTGPFLISPTFGVNPIGCLAWRWASALNNQTYLEVGTQTLLQKRNLVTPDNATNFPAASNVRSGVTYGIGGVVSGTCVVPNPSVVAAGSPVDNTVGTLASATAGEIAAAVWGAASRTITEGGITAADVWSAATRTITGGTVTTLTNAPTVPSAAAIATQVRSELSVELGRVDASISSRATPGDIPTETEIAAEVWAKPTNELTITGSIGERAKNQSTVSTTGAQLAAALS